MTKLFSSQLIWSYFAFLINLGFGIILLPFLLKYLSVNELGLWYIFNAISSFVLLLDFGFSPSISRNISYAWGGAENLFKNGIDFTKNSTTPNFTLISKITIVSQKIYNLISLLTLVILISFGTYYISIVGNKVENY